ncbi:hypothetical protein [Kocuria nitroreducens]
MDLDLVDRTDRLRTADPCPPSEAGVLVVRRNLDHVTHRERHADP